MKSGEVHRVIIIQLLSSLLLLVNFSFANTSGLPPVQSLSIPYSPYGEHFDFVQDNDNTLYIAYMHGVKIYNGDKWTYIEISRSNPIRRLYFDGKDKIYVGGRATIGYIQKDKTGQYHYIGILPESLKSKVESIWVIKSCNGALFFNDVHEVFRYNPDSQSLKHWHFDSKLGAMGCINQQLILQNRQSGLLKYQSGQWVDSTIELLNNEPIYQFESLDTATSFILSESDEWRILENNSVKTLNFKQKPPALNDYVTVVALPHNQIALGSSNGLITFLNTQTKQHESFHLTNDWIAKILYIDKQLIILTEFEIFYIQWPSAIRIQGKEAGLASNINSLTQWNNKNYVSSSAGLLLEGDSNEQFKKLNWTSKEAWDFLPLNESQALLAESHRIVLVNADLSLEAKPISDIIYPREFIPSKYNANTLYVITEQNVKRLIKSTDDEWEIDEIFNQRPDSLVELSSNTLLLSTNMDGFIEIKLDNTASLKISKTHASKAYDLSNKQASKLKFVTSNKGEIFAYKGREIYKLENGKFNSNSLKGLLENLDTEEIIGLQFDQTGKVFAYTNSKVIQQNNNNQWQITKLRPQLRGIINNVEIINNEIKVLSNGLIITLLEMPPPKPKEKAYKLLLTDVIFSSEKGKIQLPQQPENPQSFQQGSGSISFSFALNDLINTAKSLYRYRLVGYNDVWSEYTNDSHIVFNNLPAGTYTFEVQAQNMSTNIYQSKPYPLIITPYWYLSPAAKISWLILLIFAFYLLIRYIIKWREKKFAIQAQNLKCEIDKKTAELIKANEDLTKMAHLDGLTGLSNRLYLDKFINKLKQKKHNNLIAIMLDMDYFKKYNDLNGHLNGDELLKSLAVHLKNEIINPQDIVARYGGVEFVILMVDASMSDAKEKSEKIRQLIEDKKHHISISIGISEIKKDLETEGNDAIYHAIDEADQALYQAKKLGRNRVCVY
jgi:diguanylate cyclase (GGDEF)-like protein